MKQARAPKNLRPNVCILLYNAKGQLFMGERLGKRQHWQFPQGGVEVGQTLRATALRELQEEIGVSRRCVGAIQRLKARHWYLWKSPPAYARGKWVGQAQTFWLLEFIGTDADIDLHSTDDPEFKRWRWCSIREVRKIAARERVAGYEQALREFAVIKRGWVKKKKNASARDIADAHRSRDVRHRNSSF
jgi:putative (di)nucleoside polyphosphate hydrolase